MARSVGEAAALGLESGYRMATDAKDRATREQREVRLDAERLDQQHYTRSRQEQTDTINALDQQSKILAQEGAAGHATPEAKQDYIRRVEGLNQRRNDILSKVSGYDMNRDTEAGIADVKKLQEGQVEGVNLKRASAVATKRPHTDYLRVDGQPSVVEQAGEDFMQGMEAKDPKLMLKGVNVMYAPQLRTGVGSKSPHGTIVGKEIVGLDLDPRSHPDDPHFVPRIRVYVNSGKELRGPLPEGVPKGANGYYDAPMTKNRSSDPDDPVQSVGLQQALDYMHLQGQWVEALNSPEAQAKLQQEADSPDFDENRYLQAQTSVGAAGGKKTIAYHAVPAGGSLLKTTTDAKGNVVQEQRIEGNPKPASDANPMQKKIDAIRRLGTEEGGNLLSEAEVATKIKQLTEKEVTRAPRGGGGGGSGGGGGKGGNIASTKVDGEGYVIGVFRNGDSKRLLLDGKPWKSQDFEKRIDKVAHDMSQGINGLGKSAADLRKEAREALLSKADTEPATPKKLDKLPDGAKQIGTAGGKPVYEVTNPDGTKRRFKGE
jgi:hypothetical protein